MSTSTEEENKVIVKGGENSTSDRPDHVRLTQREAEMRPDDNMSVTRNVAYLIASGLAMATGESCRHTSNRCATQDSGCVLGEENIMLDVMFDYFDKWCLRVNVKKNKKNKRSFCLFKGENSKNTNN